MSEDNSTQLNIKQDFKHQSTILLVDDDPSNLQVLGSLLKMNHYDVVAVTSGFEAINYLKSKKVDLILLDIMMPDIDGFETCQRIKSNIELKSIPIIFLTALTAPEERLKAFSVGGEDYITKPFVKEEILARVNVHVNRKIAMEKLKESESKFRSVTQSTFDAIVTINSMDQVVFWNHGARQMFGYSENEAIGLSFSQKLVDLDSAKLFEETPGFSADKSLFTVGNMIEKVGRNKNGESFPLELSYSIWHNEKELFISFVIRDITKRKRIEKLQKETEQLVRHDLKNPLAIIISASDIMLHESEEGSGQLDIVRSIFSAGKNMQQLIDRSMDFFKIEEGIYELSKENFDLISEIKEIHQEFHYFAKAHNVSLNFEIEGKPINWTDQYPVKGDGFIVRDILSNLIKNAIEASGQNDTVRLSVSRENHSHHFEVHNTGVVPEDIRDNFFDKYYTQGKKQGTGLGTYSARLLTMAHGGSIRFSSSKEDGTRVYVTIPDMD